MALKEVINYYNQCQGDYNRLWRTKENLCMHYGFHDRDHRKHDDAVINMNRVLAEMVRVKPGDKILDAGCGIGGSAIWLAKNLGAEVTGVNINRTQVKTAKKLARENNIVDSVKFLVRDFTDTKLLGNSFDLVWGIESICHTENKMDFLSEAKRLLKDGGRIIIADLLQNRELTQEEREDMGKWLSGWSIPNLASGEQFRNHLQKLGFKNIQFRDVTKNVLPSSRRMYTASLLGYLWEKS